MSRKWYKALQKYEPELAAIAGKLTFFAVVVVADAVVTVVFFVFVFDVVVIIVFIDIVFVPRFLDLLSGERDRE